MRRQSARLLASSHRPKCLQCHLRDSLPRLARRNVQIQTTPPATSTPESDPIIDLTPPTASGQPDARFEILGSSVSSTLSVSLSASQNLYTRRGTLIGAAGSPENAVSTLSLFSPLRRLFLGVPFLYQRIASTSPINLLISAKRTTASFSVLHLDGRVDWCITQRNGLVAWTGAALTVRPSINTRTSLAYWGNTLLTGRGLVALAGTGQIYQLTLKDGEAYVAHPGNVLAYSVNAHAPQPYRFKSTTLRLQLPSFSRFKFVRDIQGSDTWKAVSRVAFAVRTWFRRSVWGDRLFLRFHGPMTILLQSRGSSIRDVLTDRDVNEIADAPAGVVTAAAAVGAAKGKTDGDKIPRESGVVGDAPGMQQQVPKMTYANVQKDGKVRFDGSQ